MPALLSKPIDAIAAEDLDELCASSAPESETLELKRHVPVKSGGAAWSASSTSLSDYSKRELVKEVVALANTYGGHLIIGIDETSDNPPAANAVTPVEACADMEARLEQVLRDLTDPTIPGLQLRTVPYPAPNSTAGVLLIRVPPSRLGPHRSGADLQVYVRIGRSAMALSMREIQDRAYDSRVALDRLERKLDSRAVTHRPMLGTFPATAVIRSTAVPLAPISFPRPYRYTLTDLPLPRAFIEATVDHRQELFTVPDYHLALFDDPNPFAPNRPRRLPIVRGSRYESIRRYSPIEEDRPEISYPCLIEEIHEDGLVEIRHQNNAFTSQKGDIDKDAIAAVAANVLLAADNVRRLAGTPGVDYVVEVEVRLWPIDPAPPGVTIPRRYWTESVRLPRVVLQGSRLTEAMHVIIDDLRNFRGRPHTSSVYIKWA